MGCHSSRAATIPEASRLNRVSTPTLLTDRPRQVPKKVGFDNVQWTENTTALGATTRRGATSQVLGSVGDCASVIDTLEESGVLVSEYSSRDHGLLSALGMCCKEQSWKVIVDRSSRPIEVKSQVKINPLHGPEVHITCDGKQLFPRQGASARIQQDFHHAWPFHEKVNGIKDVNFFEMRSVGEDGAEAWVPATILKQRSDGYFEVSALHPDGHGRHRKMHFAAVDKKHLREAASLKPLTIAVSHLAFVVPSQDPLHPRLTVGNQDVIHSFGRFSPTPGSGDEATKLKIYITKDRSRVTANVSHEVLSHFVSGEVRGISQLVTKQRHSWAVQIGPFAEHTIDIEKKQSLGNHPVACISVDGALLVEASAEDLGCAGIDWQCSFRFLGQRFLEFELSKDDVAGAPCDVEECVEHQFKYSHTCVVKAKDLTDMSTAVLAIDGYEFAKLPVSETAPSGATDLSIPAEALNMTYGICVPYTIADTAPDSTPQLESAAPTAKVKSVSPSCFNTTRCGAARSVTVGGIFPSCCDAAGYGADAEVVEEV